MLSWESLHSIAVGGVAAHVTELAAALARKGHQIRVFTLAPSVEQFMSGRMMSIITDAHTRLPGIRAPWHSLGLGYAPTSGIPRGHMSPKKSHCDWTRNGGQVRCFQISGKERRIMLAIASHWTLIVVIIVVVVGIYVYRKI
jgi:hypothetical protein